MGFSESDLLKGFSSPTEPLEESFFTLLGVQHSKGVLEVFLERFRAELEPYGGVTAGLENLVSSDLNFDALWSPAIGRCFRATSYGNASLARRAAAEVLLHAAAHGVPGSWEMKFSGPQLCLWESWALPRCDYLSVSYEEQTASVVTGDGEAEFRVHFRRSPSTARWEGDGGVCLPSVEMERGTIVVLPDGALKPADLDNLKNSPVAAWEDVRPPGSLHEEAFRLLIELLPSYGAWVSRVLRHAALAKANEVDQLKRVVPAACGVFFVTDRQDALTQAAALVHAASHNYYYLASALGSASEASEAELYYSPFAQMMRTFDRLLSSYHAFANVYLFHRACLDALPARREECARRMSGILKDLRSVERMITEGSGLTGVGTALIEPLVRELRAEGGEAL